VKYVEDSVLVVAPVGWVPDPSLSAFAEPRRVKPYHVPLSRFAPDSIARLRLKHAVSTKLKKHPKRDEIILRHLP
jgi:hypothetical protein